VCVAVPPPNRAYLRTLIHNSDLEHLEKVVLDGHGYRLLHESSAIGKVNKFIQTLPDFMVSQVIGRGNDTYCIVIRTFNRNLGTTMY
jgi:hypothetical protein